MWPSTNFLGLKSASLLTERKRGKSKRKLYPGFVSEHKKMCTDGYSTILVVDLV